MSWFQLPTLPTLPSVPSLDSLSSSLPSMASFQSFPPIASIPYYLHNWRESPTLLLITVGAAAFLIGRLSSTHDSPIQDIIPSAPSPKSARAAPQFVTKYWQETFSYELRRRDRVFVVALHVYGADPTALEASLKPTFRSSLDRAIDSWIEAGIRGRGQYKVDIRSSTFSADMEVARWLTLDGGPFVLVKIIDASLASGKDFANTPAPTIQVPLR